VQSHTVVANNAHNLHVCFSCRAYETTKLYRDLKLRGSIIRDNNLMLLPQERIYNEVYYVAELPLLS
jgi:Bardet-Biedl syndrome 5 protein